MTTARDAALAFLRALRGAPANRAQERLLNTANRDLAAVLFHLTEEERSEAYAAVGPAKAELLRAELERMRHVRLGPETVSRIASHLAEHLAADKPLGPISRYFRPVKREGSDRE